MSGKLFSDLIFSDFTIDKRILRIFVFWNDFIIDYRITYSSIQKSQKTYYGILYKIDYWSGNSTDFWSVSGSSSAFSCASKVTQLRSLADFSGSGAGLGIRGSDAKVAIEIGWIRWVFPYWFCYWKWPFIVFLVSFPIIILWFSVVIRCNFQICGIPW